MIREKPGGRFEVFVQAGAKKKYVGVYRSRKEAEEAEEDARVTQRKIAAGKLPPQIDSRRTFGQSVDAWLKQLEKDGSRSWFDYSNRVDLYLKPRFENVPLVEIRKTDIVTWREWLSDRLSSATVNTVLGTASSAFEWFAEEKRWIEHNPCHKVKRLKADARVFPWLDSPEKITRLLSELPYKWRTLVAFLVGTGCRLDEALRLTWDDVSFELRLVTFRRTKNGKVRRVPITDSVLPVLNEMKLARGTEPLLWPGGRPGKRLSQPSVRKPFKAAALRAGLPREMRLHDLRHSFAGLYLANGGDIYRLARILGHTVAVCERTYAHLKSDAFEQDYARVSFTMPTEAKVYQFTRDERGQLTDRVLVAV